jgi:transcriptional regulator with XRE-family HTH domain
MVKPKELPPNRIRELREARGMSRAALAERAETAAAQIQKLELGLRQLTHTWMLKLAPALDCAPADLLPESGKAELHKRENAVATKLLAGTITALLDAKLPIDLLTERLKQFGLPTATIDLASNVLLHIGKRTEQTNDRNELIEIVTATLVASAATQPLASTQANLGQIDAETLLSRLIDSTDDIPSRHFGFDVETKERFRNIANSLVTDGTVTFDRDGRVLVTRPNEKAPKQIVPFLGIPGSPTFYVPRSRREYLAWNSTSFALIEPPAGPNAFVIELAKDSGADLMRRGERVVVDPDITPDKPEDVVFFERIHTQDPKDAYFFAHLDYCTASKKDEGLWAYHYTTFFPDGRFQGQPMRPRSRLYCVGVVIARIPKPNIDA